jgi:hypothetical protein
LKPALALTISQCEPSGPDDSEQHVSRRDVLADYFRESVTRTDGIEINENLLASEMRPQQIRKTPRVTGAVFSAVTDENTSHWAPVHFSCKLSFANSVGSVRLKKEVEVEAVAAVIIAEEDAVLGIGDIVVDKERVEMVGEIETGDRESGRVFRS